MSEGQEDQDAQIAELRLKVASLNDEVRQLSGVATTVGFVIAICLAKSDAAFPAEVSM
jgi:hypothetical protein